MVWVSAASGLMSTRHGCERQLFDALFLCQDPTTRPLAFLRNGSEITRLICLSVVVPPRVQTFFFHGRNYSIKRRISPDT